MIDQASTYLSLAFWGDDTLDVLDLVLTDVHAEFERTYGYQARAAVIQMPHAIGNEWGFQRALIRVAVGEDLEELERLLFGRGLETRRRQIEMYAETEDEPWLRDQQWFRTYFRP